MNPKSLPFLTLFCVLVIGGAAFSFEMKGAGDFDAGRAFIHPSSGGTANFSPPDPLEPGVLTYHDGPELLCAQCHVMHASQQHPHDGQAVPDPFGAFPQTFVPTENLLKASDPVALCLTCHDGVPGVPDVVSADVNGLTDRSAGYFAAPGVDNYSGHKIDYGIEVGGSYCSKCHFGPTEWFEAAVSCIECHDPHGNGRPRNLQWISNPAGTPPLGLFEDPAAVGLSKYETANVAFGTANDATLREVTNMCWDCHHGFSGPGNTDENSNGIHDRHPSYESESGDPNHVADGGPSGATDPTHWENGVGGGFQVTPRLRPVNDGATDYASSIVIDADINGVFCLSCHKAHGGDNAFGLVWDPVSGVNAEGCDQCHNKTNQ